MISTTRLRRASLPALVAGLTLASILTAAAAQPPLADQAEPPAAENTEAVPDPGNADIMKDVDISKLDWSQLNFDGSPLACPAPKERARPKSAASTAAKWSTNAKPNGVSDVSVKQSISPFWDTRIGADMTVARQGTLTTSEVLSERLANGGSLPQSSATAWAAISAPGVASVWDKTTVEARVDPAQDQSKLGTTLSKSLPLGKQYSLTLKSGYSVVQQGIVPVPGIASHPERSYEADESAKLSIADTGTSFMAGQTLSTADDKWLRKVGAEQKLFDGVTISASIGETSTGDVDKSFRAGFKHSW